MMKRVTLMKNGKPYEVSPREVEYFKSNGWEEKPAPKPSKKDKKS